MRLVVDTGVFSAALSRRRRVAFDALINRLTGNQLFLAAQTVAEVRYGALVAGWGESRRLRLEAAVAATTVVPITDGLLTTVARLRYDCRVAGHALHDRAHHEDLWIAATAIHVDSPLLTADRVFADAPGLTLA